MTIMVMQKISEIKANEMITDLKERLRLGNRLADLSIVDDIIRGWLDEYIGISEINFEYSEAGTILDTSEGVL